MINVKWYIEETEDGKVSITLGWSPDWYRPVLAKTVYAWNALADNFIDVLGKSVECLSENQGFKAWSSIRSRWFLFMTRDAEKKQFESPISQPKTSGKYEYREGRWHMTQRLAKIGKKQEKEIKAWMKSHASEYLDCGEVNCTTLAEGAAQEFDLPTYPPKYAIPEEMFEWSFEVSEKNRVEVGNGR